MKKYFSLVLTVLSLGLTYSQETKSLEILDPVLVKGRTKNVKERHEFQRHAQSTEVINEYELNRNNPAFIEQSLNTMAGVQVDKRTQIGGQRIIIRGYGNDQKFNNWGIKSYYNNIPLTVADGTTILDDIDFSVVDNVEVIKGPASSEYGAGVGGTVRFYLKTPTDEGTSMEQKTAFGSFNLFQSQTKINYKKDKTSMFFNYGHLESDGFRPHGSSVKNFYTYLGEFSLSDKEKMSVLLSYSNSYEKIAGQISYADYYAGIDNGNTAYIKKDAGNNIKSVRFGVTYQNNFTNSFSNRTTLFYYNSDQESISAGAFGKSKNPNYGVRSVFNWKKEIDKQFSNELDFGTELQQSTSLASSYRFSGTNDNNPLLVTGINTASYFDTSNVQLGFFAQNRLIYKPVNLSFIIGISANNVRFSRKDLLAQPGLLAGYSDKSFEKSFATVFNPHFAIQKSFKNQIFNLSYSFGFNSPTSSTAFIPAINKTNDDLIGEKAKMIDFSVHGLLFDSKFDYQIAIFDMQITNKLTQLSAINPIGGAPYNYWANTGNQQNRGIELSFGYVYDANGSFITSIRPFGSVALNDFKYTDFKTKFGTTQQVIDYSGQKVVGVPDQKFTLGLDFKFNKGFYMQNTFNRIGPVYTDFAQTNSVLGFGQLNSKIGFQKSFLNKKINLDIYVAGNNLTNQINYTFLFLGNSVNDSDPGSNYPGVPTDVNPGPSKAYYFGGANLKYQF